MGLNCGASLIKYLLFIFNLICFIGGIALVVVGAIALKKVGDVKDLFKDSDHPGLFAALVIAIGVVVFIIAFFGCCGAIRESQCLLNMYALCLIILVVCQVLLAIFVLVYNHDIQEAGLQGWDRLWAGRNVDINQKTVDQIQHTVKCCGSSSPLDYLTQIPASCCPQDSQACNTIYAYKNGCRSTIQSLVHDYAQYIAYLSIIMAVVELVGVIFGCCLSSHIRNSSRYE